LQLTPGGAPNDIVLHVRMLDVDARAQQEALGILGVNLIYGAFNHADSPERLIESLADDLSGGASAGSDRIEIDMIEFSGPAYAQCESRLLNLHLIRSWLTRAVMFNPDGQVVQPGEALHRKDVLAVRSNFRPVTRRHEDMILAGLKAFGGDAEDVLPVAEMTMATVMEDGDRIDNADFLARVDTLTALGYHVLVSDYLRYFRLRAFLRRYTQGRIGIVARLDNLRDIFNPDFYSDLEGGLLEAFGRLFCDKTWMYVYPGRGADGQLITADTCTRPDAFSRCPGATRRCSTSTGARCCPPCAPTSPVGPNRSRRWWRSSSETAGCSVFPALPRPDGARSGQVRPAIASSRMRCHSGPVTRR
jgi:hypothetical protein